MSKESRRTSKGSFSVIETMMQSANAVREFIAEEGTTDVDHAVAWLSFLKINAEGNEEFTPDKFDRYVEEIEEAVFNVVDPKERLSLLFQYQQLGLLMKRRGLGMASQGPKTVPPNVKPMIKKV